MNAMVKPQAGELAPINQQPSDDSKVLMMIVQKMSEDPDFDIDKVRQMIELKERLDATAAAKAYAADMAEFKKVAPTITKDQRVAYDGKDGKPGTAYNHASLGNVVETVIGKLAEFGFSHRWITKREGDRIFVTCKLTHRFGHFELETQDGGPDSSGSKNNLQAGASTRTFLERYTLLAAAGLATKEQLDDDGRTGGGAPRGEEDPAIQLANALYNKISLAETGAELQPIKDEIKATKVPDNVRRNLIASYNSRRKVLAGEAPAPPAAATASAQPESAQ
jgi:hypothetical protein